jgi:eukaryotic-like serine/threonine-protein kinase
LVSELIGSTISHYRIVGVLGEGGMGKVFRARDERLDREVALKVLPPATRTDETARARLVREARMASSLNHPHIAHVYEVGEDGGSDFIAMELVEGHTLRERIPPTGFPTEALFRYGLQVVDAVAHAHEHGLIHRDLKSTNVMVTPEGRVKVLDFGLAKRVGESANALQDVGLTASGIVMGTPNHLSPEVLRGAPADARSDVWALGVVLYEMASGKLPFRAGTISELADSITGEPAAPLSGRVPVGIQAVIQRCLAKEPRQRYQSASEVRAAIEAVEQAIAPRRRGRLAPAAWAGALVVVAIAAALAWRFGPSLVPGAGTTTDRPRIQAIAVLPLVHLSGDPAQDYFADGMTEELITSLAPIPSLTVISRTSVMRYKNSKEPLRDIARALKVDAIVEGSVQRVGDRVRITAQLIEASRDRHLWAKSFERDFKDVLALQSEVARDIANEIQLQLSPQVKARLASTRQVNPQAYELGLKGRYEWNRLNDEGIRKSIEYFEQAHRIDPSDPRASSGLADAYLLLTQVTQSLPTQEGMAKVKEYAQQALAADPNSAEAHASHAAALFFGDWKVREAEREVRRAIELNPGYATAHVVLSTILTAQGRADEAIAEDRKALVLDPYSLLINWNAIGTLVLAHRFDAALVQAHRALTVDPNASAVQGSFLRIYENMDRYQDALDVRKKHLPEAFGGQALTAAMQEGFTRSGPRGYWQPLLEFVEKQDGGSQGIAITLAYVHAQLGDKEKALAALERAYAERSGDMLYMKVEPGFDSLHDEPRFKALVRRVGIP